MGRPGENEDDMGKRVAWGLAAILAAALLGSGVALAADYQRRLPEPDRWVILLPRSEWGFGPDGIAVLRSIVAQLDGGVTWPERYRLGFWSVRVDYSTRSRPCRPSWFGGLLISPHPPTRQPPSTAPQRRAR